MSDDLELETQDDGEALKLWRVSTDCDEGYSGCLVIANTRSHAVNLAVSHASAPDWYGDELPEDVLAINRHGPHEGPARVLSMTSAPDALIYRTEGWAEDYGSPCASCTLHPFEVLRGTELCPSCDLCHICGVENNHHPDGGDFDCAECRAWEMGATLAGIVVSVLSTTPQMRDDRLRTAVKAHVRFPEGGAISEIAVVLVNLKKKGLLERHVMRLAPRFPVGTYYNLTPAGRALATRIDR